MQICNGSHHEKGNKKLKLTKKFKVYYEKSWKSFLKDENAFWSFYNLDFCTIFWKAKVNLIC